jgi:hypothetical protein
MRFVSLFLVIGLMATSSVPVHAQSCRWDGTSPFCSGSCGAGENEVTRLAGIPDFWEPPIVNMDAEFGANCATGTKALCCATSGSVCRWDGTAPFCDGGCRAGETVGTPLPGSSSGASCLTGSKVYCCRSTGPNPNPTGTIGSRLEASPEFAVYAAIWQRSEGVTWQARHGLNSADYQIFVDTVAPQGFRPLDVTGYAVDGVETYATVWEQRDGPPWVARHGLTAQGYQAEFDRLAAEGFAPVNISGYVVGGEERYAAIWEQGQTGAWAARHSITADEYQQEFDRRLGEGFRLIDVSGYHVGGVDRFAAIWVQNDGREWAARHGMSAEDYQREFNAFAEQGFRPTLVSAWVSGGTPRYAAIWEKTVGPEWVARHGMLSDTYQEEFDRLANESFMPRRITAFHMYE